jgi:hypothetical protein
VALHPYVLFLPTGQKTKILKAIFGSKAAVSMLQFALNQGVSKRIYQKDLLKKLEYSNKTIVKTMQLLTRLGILAEDMEKTRKDGHTTWVKAYELSDAGKWFALLLARKKDLSDQEKAELLQSVFRGYIKWVRNLSRELHVSKETLRDVFAEEMV